ncbi:MAG: hypothetical protein D6811_10735, partial [Alphaproteobacteria bacterium]
MSLVAPALAATIVAAVLVAMFAIPAAIQAWADGRPPRAAALGLLAATLLAVAALRMAPRPLGWADVPLAFATVLRALID